LSFSIRDDSLILNMIELILVRHGETEQNRNAIIQGQQAGDLSLLGKQQCQLLAQRLFKDEFDHCYSSDLARTKDTLSYLLALKPLPVTYREYLRERNFGELEGAHGKLYLELLKEAGQSRVDYRPPSGENFYDLKERTDLFIDDVLKHDRPAKILTISHGGTIRTIISSLINKPMEDLIKIEINNCSISRFTLEKDGSVSDYFINDCQHLAALGSPDQISQGIDVIIGKS
jgi:broad specificity phosphatase PhoE